MLATCNECLYQPICNTYASFGVTDLPASDTSPCELFKNKADVVEVVRCKDCKHRYSYDEFDRNTGEIYVCYECGLLNRSFGEDRFCSYGERKDA